MKRRSRSSPGQKLGDLLADLGHPSGDRGFIAAFIEEVRKLEAHTEEAHEQLVGGVGGVLHTGFYLHHVAQGRHIPEVRLDAGLRRRSAQGLLELLFLGAGELGGVLIAGVPGHHRAQSGQPPARQPVPNCSLAPANHLGNNAHVNTARSVKNGLGLQPHQNKRVTALLPPQNNIPLFLRHINKHVRILYHASRNFHLTRLWDAILFNVGHTGMKRKTFRRRSPSQIDTPSSNSFSAPRQCSSGRGAPAIELSDGENGTCIFIRFEGGGRTVAMGDSEGLSWPADFNDDSCEYVHYDYFGSWSEVPANLVIPREKDLAAAKSFLETGNIPSSVLPLVRE